MDQRSELPDLPEPLPGPVVDTHCHLDITSEYSGLEVEDALERAASVGVTRVVQIGCDVQQSTWAVDLARTQQSVVAGVALVVLVLRMLLAQALALDAEAHHLKSELDEVI